MNIYIHKNSTGDGYAVNVRNEHGYMISQYYANDYAKAVKTRDELKAFNGQQALRDLNKLEHCINLCDCSGVIVASVHVEVNDTSDFPAILREKAI